MPKVSFSGASESKNHKKDRKIFLAYVFGLAGHIERNVEKRTTLLAVNVRKQAFKRACKGKGKNLCPEFEQSSSFCANKLHFESE